MSLPFTDPISAPLPDLVDALRAGAVSSVELTEAALARHERLGRRLNAYKHFDGEAALASARLADRELERARGRATPGGLLGVPVSVKDIYGVTGMPTFAGSARRLPDDPWGRDGWLVARVRAAGAVLVGKTHTVEFAYGGVGMNPHWGTPLNPWDASVPRIPGGSSCGAGVSLWEGSAMVALGSDTGGSIRIPAAFTGVVGHKTTKGRWPTDGVVQLSSTFDTVGALTRSVVDAIHFFGSVDPKWGDPDRLVERLEATRVDGLRIAVPECAIWEDCAPDIRATLAAALDDLADEGAQVERVTGGLIDEAEVLYMTGGIGKAECNAFLRDRLPDWIDLLHPTVGRRLEGAFPLSGDAYQEAVSRQREMAAVAHTLFGDADVLVLPTNIVTAPPVAEVAEDLDRYVAVNLATLRPTCPVNLLQLCAISLPVGLDDAGMPVGLQIVARGGDDEALLGVALAVERALEPVQHAMGTPPALR